MQSRLKVLQPATEEVVDIQLLRQHVRVDTLYDAQLLKLYLQAATSYAEAHLDQSLLACKLQFTLSHSNTHQGNLVSTSQMGLVHRGTTGVWTQPRRVVPLPRGPLQEVESVVLTHWAQEPLELDPQDYLVEPEADRITLLVPDGWKTLDNIRITYQAGYSTRDQIPVPVVQAIQLLTCYFYEMRGDVQNMPIPEAFYHLLSPYSAHSWSV